MNKQKVIEYLKDLNQREVIKIDNNNKTRIIFKQSQKVFNIFGSEKAGVLNPFNDYTYKWLNSFLYSVIDLIGYGTFDNFEELNDKINDLIFEWVDSETDVYTSDLTEWLNSNNNNVYYLTEASEEYSQTDGFKNLQLAQYKAIEEVYNNALSILIEDLKTEFPED